MLQWIHKPIRIYFRPSNLEALNRLLRKVSKFPPPCFPKQNGPSLKAAKCEIQKAPTCRATLFRCKFWVDILSFSPSVINLSRNENVCCRLKKVVAKSRARVYFEQQMWGFVSRFSSNSQLVTQQICSCARCATSQVFVSHISPP